MTAEDHTQLMKKEEEVSWKSLHKSTVTIMPRFAVMFSKIVLFCTNISIITEISRNKEKNQNSDELKGSHPWLVIGEFQVFSV